ncbi:MAG: helix-hairpin-helix domain-containing protein [bacterium]|nr:helix-hairpin-helix domain-containing protein [bacterium]
MLQLLQRFKLSAIILVAGIILLVIGAIRIYFDGIPNSEPLKITKGKIDIQHQTIKNSIDIPLNDTKIASDIGKIKVDVSGAVTIPGVYDLPSDARINQAIEAAGGISKKGDAQWVGKNLNLATHLQDGDKIFIPAIGEIKTTPIPLLIVAPITEESSPQVAGITTTQPGLQKAITTSMPQSAPSTTPQSDGKINMNSATIAEMDVLPGIGPVTAQKIVDNRPYITLEELKEKKAVNKSTFEKIKEKIKI